MPQDMAVQRPDARVRPGDAQHHVAIAADGEGVSAERVVEVPRGFGVGVAEDAEAPADDLELLAWGGGVSGGQRVGGGGRYRCQEGLAAC